MAFCRIDKLSANAHIVSFTHSEDLVNGMIVELDKLGADKESYTAKNVANVKGKIVVHASVPFDYTETMISEFDYVLKAGQLGRGLVLSKGDIITVDAAVLTASDEIQIGNIFEPKAGKNLNKVSSRTAGVNLALEVLDLETIMGVKCAVLEVL